MRYFVVAVGKARSPYLDDLQHYAKLLSRYARVDVIEVADDEALQRRITIQNVSDPDPPRWQEIILGTHPPTIERIGQAVAIGSRGGP